MIALSARTTRGMLALDLLCLWVQAAGAQTATTKIVKAANAFLATLTSTQQKRVMFAFDDEQQRALVQPPYIVRTPGRP